MVDIVRIELNTGGDDMLTKLSDWQAIGKFTGFTKRHRLLKKDVGGIRYERITEDAAKELNLII